MPSRSTFVYPEKEVTPVSGPLPYFLINDVFDLFKKENWNWNSEKQMVVLVKPKSKPSIDNNVTSPPEPYFTLKEEKSITGENMGDIMGGCPLECPFDPNENFEEAIQPIMLTSIFTDFKFDTSSYEALDEASCRVLWQNLQQGIKIEGVTNPLCFFPCKVTELSFDPHEEQMVLMGYNKNTYIDLKMLGPFKHDSSDLNMEYFLSLHRKIRSSHDIVQRQVHVVYEKVHGEFPAKGNVFVEFMWKDPKSLFEAPPASNARGKLVVKPCLGDANPFLESLWTEVMVLDRTIALAESISNVDLQRSNLSVLAASDMESKSEVVRRMVNLLNKPTVPNWKKGLEFSDCLETVLQRVVNVDRSDADCTDLVWLILKDSTSFQELYECLNTLFTAVESKMYRPYILPSNKTTLASMLTRIVNNQLTNYRTELTPRCAVNLTLNCGLHKLFKDYSFVLGMCHLAEPRETSDFSPNGENFTASLANIKKLHCVLEVLCLTRERIALNMNELEAQTRKLLNYFLVNELKENSFYHFDVPFNTIASAVVGLNPSFWKLKMESSLALRKTQSFLTLSRDFYVGHAKKRFSLGDGSIKRGYYMYLHKVVTFN